MSVTLPKMEDRPTVFVESKDHEEILMNQRFLFCKW